MIQDKYEYLHQDKYEYLRQDKYEYLHQDKYEYLLQTAIVCCAKELFFSDFNNLHETELDEGEYVTKGRCKNVHFIIKVNIFIYIRICATKRNVPWTSWVAFLLSPCS